MATNLKLIASFLLCCLLLPGVLPAQIPAQSIKGRVIDKDTRQPLIGATVLTADLAPPKGAVTDVDGIFIIEEVPLGRHSIECTYIGYTPWRIDGLVLNKARELVLDIELKEDVTTLGEIVVTAISRPNEPINDVAVLSARSFTVEEVQHYAGAINDPGRMAQSLPGVQPSKDNEGDIIIRGNASYGLLWRLEGVDIVNPNHFARLGGSGGGLTIFSVSVLSNSDFFSGAFPAEYGNALAGVFDMRFRNGNRDRREYTFRVGMLGLEVAAEGPFVKGRSSYLLNYRYSTLGVLNQLGIHLVGPRISNNFQDLSFNIFLPGKNGKTTWRLWGVGGTSIEKQSVSEEAWEIFRDSATYQSGADVGILGLTHALAIDAKSHIKTTLSVQAQRSFYNWRRSFSDGSSVRYDDENYIQNRLAVATAYTRKISAHTNLKTGLQWLATAYDLRHDTIQPSGKLFALIDARDITWQVQPFAQLSLRPNEHWTFTAGVQAMYFGLTNSIAADPRLSLRRELNDRQSVSFATGLHSQIPPLGAYFVRLPIGSADNSSLDLMKSWHNVLAYDLLLGGQLRFHAEAYYQYLYRLPAGDTSNPTFWLLNEQEGYPARQMESTGTGTNLGLDVMLEKFFRKGAFFMLTGSVFNSTYRVDGGEEFNTQFNANVTATLTLGKEWNIKNGGALQSGLKNLYVRGLPGTPLDTLATTGEQSVLDESRPFSERVPDFWRIDFRFAWRTGAGVQLSLDVQNILNRINKRPFGWAVDPDSYRWERRDQAGITPVLALRVDL
jgi:hypothetical protein